MATASAVHSTRRLWHDRGNWSARDDRWPSAVWLGVFWIGTLAGFGTDFPRYLHENPPAPKVIAVHGSIFVVWLLLLTAQVVLVLRDRVSIHRKLGWFAVAWAGLMAVYGPWAAMAAQVAEKNGPVAFPPFLAINFVDIGGFLVLLVWGITLRKNPVAHRRMMMLSTISLADPGFNRLLGYFYPNFPPSIFLDFAYVFYGNILLIALMLAWDLRLGRVMKSYVIGAGGLLAAEYLATWLMFWPPWKTLTTGLVQAWAQHFG